MQAMAGVFHLSIFFLFPDLAFIVKCFGLIDFRILL